MNQSLFLYIDILGFSELILNQEKLEHIERLYRIIDDAKIHQDSNYKVIVFSDTIIAYNKLKDLTESEKVIEVMYLIELTQDLFLKLIGTNIFFRAVITEGAFTHYQLKNLQAYYGTVFVDAYLAEKKLSGTGLFLDKKLRRLNRIFRFKQFSDTFDYIFLTQMCSDLTNWLSRNVDENINKDFSSFPIPPELLTAASLEFDLYPELVHFREVYENMNMHSNSKVREKYLTTWNMYSLDSVVTRL